VLVDRGLLGRRREGNRIFYRIRDPNLTELIGTIKRLYCPDFNIS
jgi:DNA-binding transcriptional ArsR family regulator